MNPPSLSPGSADVLLFDLGRVVLDTDFSRVMRVWADHAGCTPADLAARFVVNDNYRHHETGKIDDATFFQNLRQSLGIALSDAQFLEGWNAIFAGDAKQGAFVRTLINVDAKDLTFKSLPDGRMRTTFDIVAITLNDTGKIMDERPKNFVLTFDGEQYRKFLERGLVTTFTLPIKKPGAYSVRLAVRDVATERVGSANQFIEVPDLKKDNLTLSGMAIQNIPFETWVKIRSLPEVDQDGSGDTMWDTSVRRFKAGSVVRFGYQIYNAKLAGNVANLTYNLKLFGAGNMVFDSGQKPLPKMIYESPKMISAVGGIRLANDLPVGDYVLQVNITDAQANRKTVTQFLQFEVVD